MNRAADRRLLFKKQDLDNGRRRREETTTQIRKSKREEQLMKRRQAPQPSETDNDGKEKGNSYTVKDIPNLAKIISSPNAQSNEILDAVRGIRRLLSVEVNPPVQEVIDAGVLPLLVAILKGNDENLLFESAWALTNVASTNMTRAVVEADATPILVFLLKHRNAEIREQAAWCLGNIAGDCHELRDYVLQYGALEGLILNVKEPETNSLLSNVVWAVSNLCRGKPSPRKELIEPAIAPLAGLLSRNVSQEVIVDAVWALSYLADGDNDRIQMVMDTNITGHLIHFLQQNHLPLMTPTVRTLGNFVTGNDVQTQAVIDAGIISWSINLLDHPNRNIRKETCWLLSNIAAGTHDQIDLLFKETGLLEKVADLARQDRWEVKREAIWTVSNIFTTGSDYNIRSLVQRDGLRAVAEALDVQDAKMVMVALEAVEKVLSVGEQFNLGYNNLMDEYNGIDHLEALQEHPNEEVYEKAVELLERFFNAEGDDEDENVAPAASADGTYSFGLPPSKQLFPAEDEVQTTPLGTANFDFTMGM